MNNIINLSKEDSDGLSVFLNELISSRIFDLSLECIYMVKYFDFINAKPSISIHILYNENCEKENFIETTWNDKYGVQVKLIESSEDSITYDDLYNCAILYEKSDKFKKKQEFVLKNEDEKLSKYNASIEFEPKLDVSEVMLEGTDFRVKLKDVIISHIENPELSNLDNLEGVFSIYDQDMDYLILFFVYKELTSKLESLALQGEFLNKISTDSDTKVKIFARKLDELSYNLIVGNILYDRNGNLNMKMQAAFAKRENKNVLVKRRDF